MDTLISLVQQSFEFVIPLIILLGALIFIHELGHFLVAKYYGVRVETFSLGFGKKILKYKHGDTTYCISAIPFGGYVKMFGDDPNVEISEEEKSYSFLHKPVGQRIAVVVAGPLMNLFFAFFLFMAIAILGDKKPLPIIGSIQPDSPILQLGIDAGDKVVKVGNKNVKTWKEMQEELNASGGSTSIIFETYPEKESRILSVDLIKKKNPNPLDTTREIYALPGVDMTPIASKIGVPEGSIAATAGLKIDDRILQVNGNTIERWYELESAIQNVPADQALELKVERLVDGKVQLTNVSIDKSTRDLASLGIERPDLYIGLIAEDSPAAKAGLKINDKILSINGEELYVWNDLSEKIRAFDKTEDGLQLKVLRGTEEINVALAPEKMKSTNPSNGKVEYHYKIGIGPVLAMTAPKTAVFYPASFTDLIKTASSETSYWTVATLMGFVRLVQNEVSARSIGGPIMIGQIASESFKIGINAFLKIMAIISINLFILNLLPIPVLDGGHLVFFTIEAIKGSPLSMSKLEKAQQVGLFLLLFLMVFALFNDFSRVFGFI